MEDYGIIDDYFKWLYEKTHLSVSYFSSIEKMFDYEFVSYIEHDDVRMADAAGLRKEYAEYKGLSQDVVDYILDSKPISVLEVLIALSERMSAEISADGDGFTYFIDIVDNMGILAAEPNEVPEICQEFVERLYPYCGMAFRLNNPKEDQRDIDLWYQMQAYLIENDL